MPYEKPNKQSIRGADPRWKTRTVAGVKLTKLRGEGEEGWSGVIAGEEWRFYQQGDRRWQGYTADHITGTARSFNLTRTIKWVVENVEEWQAKVKVRRAKGTRLVDPAKATG